MTLVLAAVLLGLAAPPLRGLRDRAEVTSATADVVAMLATARAAAVARGERVQVEIAAARGALVVIAGVDDARRDTVRTLALTGEGGVRLAVTRPRIVYTPTGMGYGASNTSIVLARGASVETVTVSRLGRVRH